MTVSRVMLERFTFQITDHVIKRNLNSTFNINLSRKKINKFCTHLSQHPLELRSGKGNILLVTSSNFLQVEYGSHSKH